MSYEKHRESYMGCTIRIVSDDHYEDDEGIAGDVEWGALHCFHRRYRFPHVDTLPSSDECESWEDMRARIESEGYHAFPISMHDHSGTSVHLGVSRGWDSGQIGFAVVPSSVPYDEAQKRAQSLVGYWDAIMTGNVWGYIVTDAYGYTLESVWGFVGDDPDTIAEILSEARAAADHEFDRRLNASQSQNPYDNDDH